MIDLFEKIGYNIDKSKNGGYDLKILVVFTGGTIGSSISDGYAVPDSDKKYKLICMKKAHRKIRHIRLKKK